MRATLCCVTCVYYRASAKIGLFENVVERVQQLLCVDIAPRSSHLAGHRKLLRRPNTPLRSPNYEKLALILMLHLFEHLLSGTNEHGGAAVRSGQDEGGHATARAENTHPGGGDRRQKYERCILVLNTSCPSNTECPSALILEHPLAFRRRMRSSRCRASVDTHSSPSRRRMFGTTRGQCSSFSPSEHCTDAQSQRITINTV